MGEAVTFLGGRVALWLGDCLDIVPTLAGVGVIVTDPPYGIKYQSGYATDTLWQAGRTIRNDETTGARDALLALIDVPALVFGSRKVPPPTGTRMILTWDKGPALGMGDLSLPWKPTTEEIYVVGKGWTGERDEGSCLYCPPVQSMAKNGRLHPNEKPVPLLLRLIRKAPPGTILDPFMGSGSTGIAAMKLGLRFVGIEIEPRYFDIACERIEEAARQGNLFDAPSMSSINRVGE